MAPMDILPFVPCTHAWQMPLRHAFQAFGSQSEDVQSENVGKSWEILKLQWFMKLKPCPGWKKKSEASRFDVFGRTRTFGWITQKYKLDGGLERDRCWLTSVAWHVRERFPGWSIGALGQKSHPVKLYCKPSNIIQPCHDMPGHATRHAGRGTVLEAKLPVSPNFRCRHVRWDPRGAWHGPYGCHKLWPPHRLELQCAGGNHLDVGTLKKNMKLLGALLIDPWSSLGLHVI